MCWSEKVKNNLYRIECSERNLYEESIPVAHGTVPEAWKLESLELTALIALRADESCILVNILEEIEALSLIVMKAAYDVNRVEVGCICEALTCMII